MKNEDRLVEVMAELLAEVHEMRVDTSRQLTSVETTLTMLQTDVRTLQKQQAQTNIELSEIRLSLMKLADMSERVIRLENEVFRKTG